MIALGVGRGTVIGFERRPVPKGQAAYQIEQARRIAANVAKLPLLLIQK
jgi:hypothetical protein